MPYPTATYDFAGAVALVTGGASGIGAQVVQQLRRSGATVAVWDLADPAGSDSAWQVDVSDHGAVKPTELSAEVKQLLAEVNANGKVSAAENAALDAAGDDRQLAFFRCWTRKEALVKALGCGLSLDTRSFSVATGRPAAAGARFAAAGIESDEGEDQAWALFDLDPGQGFVGAIALKCRKQTPRITLNSHPPSLETPIGTIHSMAEKVGD